MDCHLADFRLNKPNFGAGLFHKYVARPVDTEKSGKCSRVLSFCYYNTVDALIM